MPWPRARWKGLRSPGWRRGRGGDALSNHRDLPVSHCCHPRPRGSGQAPVSVHRRQRPGAVSRPERRRSTRPGSDREQDRAEPGSGQRRASIGISLARRCPEGLPPGSARRPRQVRVPLVSPIVDAVRTVAPFSISSSIKSAMILSRVPRAGTTEDHGDDIVAITLDRGQKIEARSAGIAGLDSVHPLDAIEEVIVVLDRRAGIVEDMGGKIVIIAREALLDRRAQGWRDRGPSSAVRRWEGQTHWRNACRSFRAHAPSAVMSCAKLSSSPPMASAMATAISFAERVTTALIASSTSIVSPGLRPSLVGFCAAACEETRISLSSRRWPFSSCSNKR